MEQNNEDFYERALETYTSLMDKKIQELEMFVAKISAGSRESNSALHAGGEALVGGEGISYCLVEDARDRELLAWGDNYEENVSRILQAEEWKNVSGVQQKILYKIGSQYPQLSVPAYVSRDSMQSNLIEWAVNIRRLLLCTTVMLLIICGIAIYISYKPMHELVSEFDYSGGSEFETIRHVLKDKDSRILEQEMLILDLLINHLIYGIPISKERIRQLGTL